MLLACAVLPGEVVEDAAQLVFQAGQLPDLHTGVYVPG